MSIIYGFLLIKKKPFSGFSALSVSLAAFYYGCRCDIQQDRIQEILTVLKFYALYASFAFVWTASKGDMISKRTFSYEVTFHSILTLKWENYSQLLYLNVSPNYWHVLWFMFLSSTCSQKCTFYTFVIFRNTLR